MMTFYLNWVKMSAAMVTRRRKIKKTLANLIFGILFLTILFRTYNVFILVHMFQWTLSDLFFNFQILYQKVSEPTETSKTDHSFYNTVSLKKLILRTSAHFTLKMICSCNTAKKLSAISQQICYLILPSTALKRWNFPENLDFNGKIVAIFLIRSHFLSIQNNMTIKITNLTCVHSKSISLA